MTALRRAAPAALVFVLAVAPRAAAADAELPDAASVITRVNAQERGAIVEQLTMTLSEPAGSSREISITAYRRVLADQIQSYVDFTAPPSEKGTRFLLLQPTTAGGDDSLWLYLAGMRNTRRIPANRRGDAFYSSDFTLLEVSTGTRLRTDLATFTSEGREAVDGTSCVHLAGTPVRPELVEELGYDRIEYWIDESTWIPRRVALSIGGKPIKEIRFDDVRRDGDVWRVWRRSAETLATHHRTVFQTSALRSGVELPDSMFTETGLLHGPPRDAAFER